MTDNDPQAGKLADKVAKLPQWVQTEIRRLTRDRDEWKRRATAGPENSDTFVIGPSWQRDDDTDTPLGARPRILFVLPDGKVEAHIVNGAVEVSADPRMLIAPRGNGITITGVAGRS